VKRGAALLDQVRPGWWREIALDRLAMESCNDCILGQLYGGFDNGVRTLDLNGMTDDWFRDVTHGFEVRPLVAKSREDILRLYAVLANLWRAEIRARLAASEAAETFAMSDLTITDAAPAMA
jgi:hypothetical protein